MFWMQIAKMRSCFAIGLVVLLGMVCVTAGRSQSTNGSGSNGNANQGSLRDQRPNADSISPFDDTDNGIMQRHLVALNVERQKEMVSDTNKLLKLAKELNEEVAASHATGLTPDQMRKIAEIEKLAKNVRERMTSAVGPQQRTPYVGPPFGMTPGTR
jgi:hypothetical protein